MECYYHPDRDGTDTCAICGKSICKECGLELAGKIYCKECLEKIVGLGAENKAAQVAQNEAVQEPVRTEPARLDKQPAEESVYQTQNVAEEVPPAPEVHEIKQIRDDSPYNIKDNIEYSGGIETSYEKEPVQPQVEQRPISQEPQIAQTEIPQQAPSEQAEFIYPDHSYDPQPTSARMDLEDRYEKYLDDLYFDDNVPLGEQLAKDEEQYGSLTRKEYPEREETLLKDQKRAPENETPEEMEARIRAELLAEKEGGKKGKDNIHNLNYQEEKEPMGVVDILLTILLVIIILVVIYYLIYIFILHATYPTFMEAIYALSNPQNVINNILSPPPSV
ncbi:hypothetical protein [Methanobrevibacter sp.]|uniref:hypothetical protein n=1 Tax=Methanobrevibacter sp. TaxID=66852 RepID=UPI003870D1C6